MGGSAARMALGDASTRLADGLREKRDPGQDCDFFPEPLLVRLLHALADREYRFVTPTPATHARVLARVPGRLGRDLRDIFGWSMRFLPGALDKDLLAILRSAHLLDEENGLLRSRVRVSSLGGDLYLHSAFPTDAADAVFLGPDSYRFADLIASEFTRVPPKARAIVADVGTGAGVGAIAASKLTVDAEIVVTDVNSEALRLARANIAAAGHSARTFHGGGVAKALGPLDVVLINPPYIIDEAARAYRDGGGMHGAEVALHLAGEAVAHLAPSGRLILYTGSAIVHGFDPLEEALRCMARAGGCSLRYRELDPDVFGEELDKPAYRDVERIALVAAILER